MFSKDKRKLNDLKSCQIPYRNLIFRLMIPFKDSIDTVVPCMVVNSFAVHVSKILFSKDVRILPVAGVVCIDRCFL